jgi:predicted RNA-binding Zn ribbon-like protein
MYGMDSPALDLVNSRHRWTADRVEDRLEERGWLEDFLTRVEPGLEGRRPTRSQKAKLAELRALLRRITEATAGGRPAKPTDLEELNGYLAHPLVRRLERDGGGYRVVLAPSNADWGWVLAQVAASFAELLAAEHLERLKLCDDPDCGFAFYDETKNGARRWCSSATCGNRAKVRRFRSRQHRDRRATGRADASTV